jgi:serine/threonine-protein kinase
MRTLRLGRLGALGALGVSAALAAFAACFPAYDFTPAGDAGAGADATNDGLAPVEASAADVATDAPQAPDAPGGVDASDGGGDAPSDAPVAADVDAGIPFDAGSFDASVVAIIEAGTYTFTVVDNGTTIDATATITYTLAIDRYEVTVDRFARWVDAGLPTPGPDASVDTNPTSPYAAVMRWDSRWDTIAQNDDYTGSSNCDKTGGGPATFALGDAGAAAVTCVNRFQALAFCAFEGKRLPTEVEWRIAAVGAKQHVYPWGDSPAPDCAHATFQGCPFPVRVGAAAAGVSSEGVYDLVGGVREWIWDESDETHLPSTSTNWSGVPGDMSDPANAVASYIQSGFVDNSSAMRTDQATNNGTCGSGYTECGFRCVQTR